MNTCRIFIVRHTQTTGNIEKRLTGRHDYEITAEGQKYIQLLTDELKNVKFDAIYSSTSGRAKKTIMLLAEKNRKPIIQKEDLCEMYFGIYDGWTWEEVNKINPQIRQNQITTNEIAGIPEQESMDNVAERVYKCIETIAMENIGKNSINRVAWCIY